MIKPYLKRASMWSPRKCCVCGKHISQGTRADVRTCGGACRVKLHRLRQGDGRCWYLDADGLVKPFHAGAEQRLIWRRIDDARLAEREATEPGGPAADGNPFAPGTQHWTQWRKDYGRKTAPPAKKRGRAGKKGQ